MIKPLSTSRLLLSSAALLSLLATGCDHAHNADVVAKVNGHPIMRTEMEKFYKNQLGEGQQQNPTAEQSNSLKLNVLRELIDEEIVQERAAKMNLTATNEEVDAKLAEMKSPYTEEQFQQRLTASNHTVDDVKHDLRRSLTIDKLLNKEINSRINVSDSDVTNYYNQHKAEFNLIEAQYHLAQIIVTAVANPQAANLQANKVTNEADAHTKIQALKNRLDSGEDFGAIAMNFSENPQTATNGGDMGFIADSQLHTDATVYGAVSKLKAGQITDIIPMYDSPGSKRVIGYAIFKLIAREPAGQRDLSDPRVQQNIRQQLREGRSQLLKNAYFEMLRDQAKIENFFAEELFKNASH